MALILQCKCAGDLVCNCGYWDQIAMIERAWQSMSWPEINEICANLGIQPREIPHPPDIHSPHWGEGQKPWRGGDRHPMYSLYEWAYVTKAWRWAARPEKGN